VPLTVRYADAPAFGQYHTDSQRGITGVVRMIDKYRTMSRGTVRALTSLIGFHISEHWMPAITAGSGTEGTVVVNEGVNSLQVIPV